MQINHFFYIVLTVILLSIGQVLFKIVSAEIDFFNPTSFFKIKFFLALLIYILATLCWLFVLKDIPLKTAYPFASLAFFLVPIFSYYFIGEDLNSYTFIGAAFIFFGVWISTF
jgi:drug/metabolite transporter (DMT)-like permease